MERLEAFVWQWVQDHASGDNLRKAEAERLATAGYAEGEAQRIRAEIKRLESRSDRLVELYVDEGIDRPTYDQKRKEYSEALARAVDALRESEATARMSGAGTQEVFRGIVAVWDDATPHERREALSRIIAHVTVNKGTHWNPDKYVITPRWERVP